MVQTHTTKSSKLHEFVETKVRDGTEFDIPQVSASFIHKQLCNLKVNKATGIDEISAKYLKVSAADISEPLATVTNQIVTDINVM